MQKNNKNKTVIPLKYRLQYIITLWSEHKTRIILLIILSLINTTASTIYPLLLRYVIDNLANPRQFNNVAKAIGFIIAAASIAAIFYTILQQNRVYTNMSFLWKITITIFNWILRKNRNFFHKFSHGELLTRLTDEVEKVSWMLCSGFFRFFDSISIITFSLVFMVGFSWKLTLFVVLPIVIVLFMMILFDQTWENLFETLQEKISSVNSNIEKTFASIKVIKSNQMEDFAKKEFNNIMSSRKNSEIKLAFFHGIWHSLDLMINYSALLLIIILGGKQVIKNEISLGTFIAFMQYFYLMFEYLYSFAYFFIDFKRALVSIGRHLELLFFENEIKDIKFYFNKKLKYDDYYDDRIKITKINKVELKNIYLEIGNRKILDNVSCKFSVGKIYGITGEIGSGKSMLMNILSKLDPFTAGEIYVNDLPLERIDLNSYQNQIGFVFQEPQLFSVSIKENIILPQDNLSQKIFYQYNNRKFLNSYIPFKPEKETLKTEFDYDDKLFFDSILISNLEDDIKSFPDGVDTLVGPRGYTLSGGQRERITIARAFYKNPSLFIFDDSTRSLDYETEQKVLSSIRNNNKNAIIIIITQRIRSIVFADEILVFKDGKIISNGTHDILMKESKDYKQLYEKEVLNMKF
ncbi:MAG: ABC transporter ATP-binding protein [Exilispira sp.]